MIEWHFNIIRNLPHHHNKPSCHQYSLTPPHSSLSVCSHLLFLAVVLPRPSFFISAIVITLIPRHSRHTKAITSHHPFSTTPPPFATTREFQTCGILPSNPPTGQRVSCSLPVNCCALITRIIVMLCAAFHGSTAMDLEVSMLQAHDTNTCSPGR